MMPNPSPVICDKVTKDVIPLQRVRISKDFGLRRNVSPGKNYYLLNNVSSLVKGHGFA
jgi:hypothetical protein